MLIAKTDRQERYTRDLVTAARVVAVSLKTLLCWQILKNKPHSNGRWRSVS
jgi:hypothetical protein